MNRSAVLALVLVGGLLLSAGTGVAAEDGLGSLQSGDVETDSVVLQAAVDADGDATWTIDYRIRLEDENTTRAFESLQADIRNNSTEFERRFGDRMRSTVDAAENATGREMTVSNVTVSTRTTLDGQYGIVSYGFRWTGFAATADDRIVVGDALAGLFLDADTKLTFIWPEGYEVSSVEPAPDSRSDRSVTWQGPTDFGTDQPRLVVSTPGPIPDWALALLALLLVFGGVGWYYRERLSGAGGESVEPPADAVPAEGEPVAGRTTSAGDAAGAGSADDAADSGSAGARSDTPEELLSPEERVLNLLDERGGRMKQQVVTEELGWSAARTSQVVSDLRDAGEVESFRLGRENVLRFPEESDTPGDSP